MITDNPTTMKIEADLKQLGVAKNDNLLVHSSLRSLGELPSGAETFISALLRVLGSEGTLLMPALSHSSVNSDNPVFDLLNTPCCVGALPEYFRKRPGTLRSIHPTHSVCGTGHNAQLLLGDHYKDSTPCGKNSPYYKLKDLGGWILFVGCGLNPNTSMHAIEELIEPEYLFSEPVDYQIILPENQKMHMRIRRHGFKAKGWAQAYGRLINIMSAKYLRQGKILNADCYLVDVQNMWQMAHMTLNNDPLYFVERIKEE